MAIVATCIEGPTWFRSISRKILNRAASDNDDKRFVGGVEVFNASLFLIILPVNHTVSCQVDSSTLFSYDLESL